VKLEPDDEKDCLSIYPEINKKVKVKVKFTLYQATKAQRGRRGIASLFL
jgi:hypothetical protein